MYRRKLLREISAALVGLMPIRSDAQARQEVTNAKPGGPFSAGPETLPRSHPAYSALAYLQSKHDERGSHVAQSAYTRYECALITLRLLQSQDYAGSNHDAHVRRKELNYTREELGWLSALVIEFRGEIEQLGRKPEQILNHLARSARKEGGRN